MRNLYGSRHVSQCNIDAASPSAYLCVLCGWSPMRPEKFRGRRGTQDRCSDFADVGLQIGKLNQRRLWNRNCFLLRLMAKAERNQAWWLESGRESCSKCGHQYVYETGYYCEGCDGPLCSICVETFSASIVCVGCDSSERGEP